MVEDQKVEENLLAPGFTMEKTNRAWPFNFHFFFGPVVFELFTFLVFFFRLSRSICSRTFLPKTFPRRMSSSCPKAFGSW